MTMAESTVNLELLLSRAVTATNGRRIGRLEEIRAEERDGECVVTEYLVGRYAAFERLSAWPIGRSVLGALGLGRREGYRIRWDQLDISDAAHPRLLCPVEELARLDA
jgi:sporulation protein YlmC with PRC-barrel domain